MIRQALQSFCESRYRWLIVTGGTFVVGLVLIVPLVDVYSAEHDEKTALLAELDSATQSASQLEQFERRVAEAVAQLDALEARCVDEQRLPVLRNRLVNVARETGCSLRRLNVGAVGSRPWHKGDDPTNPPADAKRTKKNAFDLRWQPITISVTGTVTNLYSFLAQLDKDNMLDYTKTFEIYPTGVTRRNLTLDVELWYYSLARPSRG